AVDLEARFALGVVFDAVTRRELHELTEDRIEVPEGLSVQEIVDGLGQPLRVGEIQASADGVLAELDQVVLELLRELLDAIGSAQPSTGERPAQAVHR